MSDATERTTMIEKLKIQLGGGSDGDGMIEIELDPEHYDAAVNFAIDKIYEYSTGGVEEQFVPLTVEPSVNQYQLPKEVLQVKKVLRRSLTHSTGGGSEFDPFDAAFKNAYLLDSGRTGGVATWDFFSQYQETIQRVFVGEMDFIWHVGTKRIELIRQPRETENVLINAYLTKSEDDLLTNPHTKSWIREWALAECKEMLGQARNLYPGGLPGATGNVTLNGDQLLSEAQSEKERLVSELKKFRTGNVGMPFLMG